MAPIGSASPPWEAGTTFTTGRCAGHHVPLCFKVRSLGRFKAPHASPLPPFRRRSLFTRAVQRASTHFSSFFGETNSSSIPLAYELRVLELEERVLKLEGMLAKSSAKFGPRGGATNGRTDAKGSGVPPTVTPVSDHSFNDPSPMTSKAPLSQ